MVRLNTKFRLLMVQSVRYNLIQISDLFDSGLVAIFVLYTVCALIRLEKLSDVYSLVDIVTWQLASCFRRLWNSE